MRENNNNIASSRSMKISYHSLSFYFQRTLWFSLRELWWHFSNRWQNFGYGEHHVWERGNSKASIHCVLCAWPWWHHCHTVDLVLDGREWLLEKVRLRRHGKLLSHLASGKATTFVCTTCMLSQALCSQIMERRLFPSLKFLKLNFL